MPKAHTLMVQGCTSDAGKSTLVTALARILVRKGLAVAPFKPQNMALNSAVTAQGGEIGRAQAVQARAARLEPHTDMNPVLLKPSSDIGAQVIIHGKSIGAMSAVVYHDYKRIAMGAVLASHQRLATHYDVILVEGAGSPAEINLRDRDIANMGFAEAVDCPVILIADIDRGGVFAHLVGTLALLSESEQRRVKGFVINRFRGDISLLQSGLDWLENYTGKPVLGVLSYLHGLHLEAEDAICQTQERTAEQALRIIVPALPRISNHTDFDCLRLHPQVSLTFVGPDQAIPPADLIILPGSKNVRSDLQWLRNQGWEAAIQRHLRLGGKLIGICGGFQMLGTLIEDPDGLEDQPGELVGLGYLDMQTRVYPDKQLHQRTGLLFDGLSSVKGYEIHAGLSSGPALSYLDANTQPALHFEDGTPEGCLTADNQILGTYLHGLFDAPDALNTFLTWAGLSNPEHLDYAARCEADIDRLADATEAALDMDLLLTLLA